MNRCHECKRPIRWGKMEHEGLWFHKVCFDKCAAEQKTPPVQRQETPKESLPAQQYETPAESVPVRSSAAQGCASRLADEENGIELSSASSNGGSLWGSNAQQRYLYLSNARLPTFRCPLGAFSDAPWKQQVPSKMPVVPNKLTYL
ncbi:MAG: hypothetical protein HYX79_06170 [Chloroflexi bacterium]|nr:hypothetical protein [Chloroflexota bacterium]